MIQSDQHLIQQLGVYALFFAKIRKIQKNAVVTIFFPVILCLPCSGRPLKELGH